MQRKNRKPIFNRGILFAVLCILVLCISIPAISAAAEQLPAPQNLHAKTVSSDTITMTWDAVPGASYYRFYRNGQFAAIVTGTLYTCGGLTANTVYGFKIAAVDSGGTLGAYSGHTYVRTRQLAVPQNLHAVTITADSIAIACDSIPGISTYTFRLHKSSNGITITQSQNTPCITFSNLDADTAYSISAAAVYDSGNAGEYCAAINVRTLLAAPRNLRAAATADASVTLAWDGVSGASYYRFYLNGRYLTAVTGTSYTASGLEADTVYGFKVAAAKDSGDVGAYSSHIYVRTGKRQLAAPQNLHAAEITADSITMTWNSVPGTSYYRFYKNGVYIGNVNGFSYTSTGLYADTVYGFKVAAVDAEGTLGAYSGNVYKRTASRHPAPEHLRYTAVSGNAIAIAWNSVPDAIRYLVYRNNVYLAEVYATSYTDNTLFPDTVYGYKVVAVGSDHTLGAFCNNIYVKTKSRLPAPQNLCATATDDKSITLTWNNVPGVSYYRFYINGRFAANVYGTAYTCSGLESDTVYGFKTVAVSANGILGAYSKHLYVRTWQTRLLAPQNLRSTAIVYNAITMEWSSVAGAAYYRFYKNGVFIANVFSTAYECTVLDSGTVYGFKVAAVRADGTLGHYSNHVYVKTIAQLPAPQNLRSSSVGSDSILILWDSLSGASYYTVYRNGTFVANTVSNSFADTGLSPDTAYQYKVAAVSSLGTMGLFCDAISVTTDPEAQLPAPANLHATAVYTKSITVAWNSVAGAVWYHFYRDGVFIAQTTGTSYTSSNLSVGATYTFKVLAISSSGKYGAFSETLSVTTQDELLYPAPYHLTYLYNSYYDTFVLYWNDTSNAKYYKVYRDGIYFGRVYRTDPIAGYQNFFSFKFHDIHNGVFTVAGVFSDSEGNTVCGPHSDPLTVD